MVISDAYRNDAFTAMKALMIPKPDAPQLKGLFLYAFIFIFLYYNIQIYTTDC